MSTAETVTDISGRGVGMSAVRSFIINLGGKLELEVGKEISGKCPFKIKIQLPRDIDKQAAS